MFSVIYNSDMFAKMLHNNTHSVMIDAKTSENVDHATTMPSATQFDVMCDIFGCETEEQLFLGAGVVVTGPGLDDFTVTEYQPLGLTWAIADEIYCDS